jgi:flagellar biosynthetic protein FlhB
MPPQDETGEKTEDATPRQRERAREEGRVAMSREVGTLFILTAATVVIYAFGPYMTRRLLDHFVWVLQNLSTLDVSEGGTVVLLRAVFVQVILIIGPVMLALVVASVAGAVIQTGFLMSATPLQPKGNRINPLEGAKRLLSWRILMETGKSIFKFTVVGLVSYHTLKPILPWASTMMDGEPSQVIPALLGIGLKVALYILAFMLVVALSDYAFQRWDYEKNLRMSRYEVRQELKQTEGDPQIRARVRSIRQQQLRQRMMEAVREAEVVITNPTHFAVALRYDALEREAPHVTAKGRGRIAQRIKEIAQENNVSLYEDKWLARQLYRTCNVGDTIPIDLWQAVAKVLAFVRTLGKKRIAV